MKINLSIAFLLFVLTTNICKSQTTQVQEEKYPETVVVRLLEPLYKTNVFTASAKIITVTPDNTIETKSLQEVNLIKGEYTEEISQNLVKLRVELQKWQNAGFVIRSSSSSGEAVMVTTITLTKN